MNGIWFKAQRAIRTAVQVVVTAAGSLATVVVVAPQVIEALAEVLPGPVVVWLTGAVATLAAISAALARVMAIPAVDAWLTRLGLGSAPRGAVVVTNARGSAVPLTRKEYQALQDAADEAGTEG